MAKKLAFKIYYDEMTGEIKEVVESKRFKQESELFKIDVLQDASEAINSIYIFERNKLFNKQFGIT